MVHVSSESLTLTSLSIGLIVVESFSSFLGGGGGVWGLMRIFVFSICGKTAVRLQIGSIISLFHYKDRYFSIMVALCFFIDFLICHI